VTVDLRTGTAHAPLPSERITRQTAVAPDPHSRCPLVLSFLDQSTGGDQGMIAFLQQWFGYCLTGSTKEHALIFFAGTGGNGKSVLLNTITGILGGYAVTASLVSCCRFRGHEDKIVTKEPEIGYDETEVQPRVQDRGCEAGYRHGCGGGAGRA
jgi:putative DNA primase/helicase